MRLDPAEVPAGAGYLAGELRQRQTGVGWAGLRDLPPPAAEPTLTVAAVDAAIDEIAAVPGPRLAGPSPGAGRPALRRGHRRRAADAAPACSAASCGRAPRPGCSPTRSPGPPTCRVAAVRRALLLAGDLRAVAVAALAGGAAALAGFGLQVGRPLAPMLAQSAPTVDEALAATGVPAVVDVKLDGIRIQVHRSGDDIAVFTRSLDEITARLPEVVAAVRALPARELVLDGEAIGLDADRPPAAVPGDLQPGRPPHHAEHHRPHPVAPAVLAAAETTGDDRADAVLLRPAAPRRRRT